MCTSSSPARPDSSAPIWSRRSTRAARPRSSPSTTSRARTSSGTSSTARSPTILDKDEFLVRLVDGDFDDDIAAILHQGACSDTMETDGRYMMRNNYRYSVALLDWCQDNDVPLLYASSASVYGGGRDVPGGARVRGAAQRLWLLEVPVRPARAAAAARPHGADRRLSLLQRLRAARAAQGADGVGRVALLQPVPRRRPRAGCSRAPAATRPASSDAISCRSTTWSRSISTFSIIRSAAASSTSARARGDVQRGRRGDDQRLPRRGGRAGAGAARAGRGRRDRLYPVSAGARRQVPELHGGRPRAAARRRAIARRCRAWRKACRATSNG